MRTYQVVALSALAGSIMGSAAIQTIHAQAKPPVYVVNEIEVTDKAGFQSYADANSKLIQKHGGKYIIRGGKVVATLDGDPPTDRYTIYMFENQDKMQAWRDDPAQKDVVATRSKLGKFRAFVVEGLAN